MQLTKFLTIVLVAAFCCTASLATVESPTCDATLLGGLGGLLGGVLGIVVKLLFVPSYFFLENGKVYCRGKCTVKGVPGAGDMVGDCKLPVKQIHTTTVHGTCELIKIDIGDIDANILGLKLALNEVILNVTGDTRFALGAILCKLLGSNSGYLDLLDVSDLGLLAGLLSNLL